MTELVHLVYASEATTDLGDKAVCELLERARKHNTQAGLTGLLLLVERSFLQVLEGAPDVIALLYRRILVDKRHCHIVKLIEEPIDRRDFQDWSMGLARLSPKELAGVPGVSDFFTNRRSLDGLGAGTARKVLGAFQQGRFRARVGG